MYGIMNGICLSRSFIQYLQYERLQPNASNKSVQPDRSAAVRLLSVFGPSAIIRPLQQAWW